MISCTEVKWIVEEIKEFTALKLANNVHFGSLGRERQKHVSKIAERTASNVCIVSRDAKENQQTCY